MGEIEYITLAEAREILKKAAKKRQLTHEQEIALQHLDQFTKLDAKKARNLVKELSEIEFISDVNAVKIADLLPTHPDDVRAIFAKERFTLGEDEIEKILETVRKYL